MNTNTRYFILKALDLILILTITSIMSLIFPYISKQICYLFSVEFLTPYTLLSQSIGIIIISLFAWKIIKKKNLSEIGLTSLKAGFSHLLIGLILGIIAVSLCVFFINNFGNVTIHFNESIDLKYLFVTIITLIIAAFSEELLIRGYMYSTISKGSKKSKIIAIYTTSLFFASMYLANSSVTILAFINFLLLGLLYGYMYYCTDNIWMCIGTHISWLIFEKVIFGFNAGRRAVDCIFITSAPYKNILNGGNFGLEGSIFCSVVLVVVIVYVWRKLSLK